MLSLTDMVSVLRALITAPGHLPAQLLTQRLEEQEHLSSLYLPLRVRAVQRSDAALPSPARTRLGAETSTYLRHVSPFLVPRHGQTGGTALSCR